MRTVKYIAAFTLALLLIVSSAFLPSLASAIDDAARRGRVYHTDIDKPNIDIGIKKGSYTVLEKLSIYLIGQMVEYTDSFFIPNVKPSREISDIPAAALEELTPYFRTGVFLGFDDQIKGALKASVDAYQPSSEPSDGAEKPEAESTAKRGVSAAGMGTDPDVKSETTTQIMPVVYYLPGNASTFFFAWSVSIACPKFQLYLLIDDDTEATLTISFYRENVYLDTESIRDMLYLFCDIYFDGINESDTLEYYRENDLMEDMYDTGLEESFTNAGYRFVFGDIVYGQMALYLEVHEQGFRTYISYA